MFGWHVPELAKGVGVSRITPFARAQERATLTRHFSLRLSLFLRERRDSLPEVVHGHDVRMAEHGHRGPHERSGLRRPGLCRPMARGFLLRHEAVQPPLPGLVDHAHPASADQFQDFQVREERRQLAGVGGAPAAESGPLGEAPVVCDSSPRFSRHAGQSPCGASAANSCATLRASILLVHGRVLRLLKPHAAALFSLEKPS